MSHLNKCNLINSLSDHSLEISQSLFGFGLLYNRHFCNIVHTFFCRYIHCRSLGCYPEKGTVFSVKLNNLKLMCSSLLLYQTRKCLRSITELFSHVTRLSLKYFFFYTKAKQPKTIEKKTFSFSNELPIIFYGTNS